MSKLEVRVFDSLASCAALSADMARVNQASPRPCPFSTFEFLANHVAHNGIAPEARDASALILTAHRGGELVGYMPLSRVSDHVLGRDREKIEYLVRHDVDRPHLVARQQDLAACAEAFYRKLLETEREWTFLELEQQDEASPLYPIPASLDLDAFHVRLYEGASNATIDVIYPTLLDYFRAFSKKMRSNVGRYSRRLFESGEVQVLSSSGGDGCLPWLDVYRSVEARSWKNGIDWVVGEDPRRVGYFRGLMGAGQPMTLGVQVLTLDGCPIAAIINGRFLNGMHALQIAYDERFRELDPGAMMLLVSMKKAIDERCAFYDLLSGYGYFKERWLARMTPSRSVQVFRKGSLHHLKALGGEYKRQVLGGTDPQADAKRNLAKPAVVDRADVEHARSTSEERQTEGARLLGQLRGSGVPMGVLAHDDLLAAMPFAATG
jgi:hypothetical protein